MQAEYCDKDVGQEEDEEEEDEDIVYMGMDGIVYRKFKYSMLEGDEEGEEVELEYDDMILSHKTQKACLISLMYAYQYFFYYHFDMQKPTNLHQSTIKETV